MRTSRHESPSRIRAARLVRHRRSPSRGPAGCSRSRGPRRSERVLQNLNRDHGELEDVDVRWASPAGRRSRSRRRAPRRRRRFPAPGAVEAERQPKRDAPYPCRAQAAELAEVAHTAPRGCRNTINPRCPICRAATASCTSGPSRLWRDSQTGRGPSPTERSGPGPSGANLQRGLTTTTHLVAAEDVVGAEHQHRQQQQREQVEQRLGTRASRRLPAMPRACGRSAATLQAHAEGSPSRRGSVADISTPIAVPLMIVRRLTWRSGSAARTMWYQDTARRTH